MNRPTRPAVTLFHAPKRWVTPLRRALTTCAHYILGSVVLIAFFYGFMIVFGGK